VITNEKANFADGNFRGLAICEASKAHEIGGGGDATQNFFPASIFHRFAASGKFKMEAKNDISTAKPVKNAFSC